MVYVLLGGTGTLGQELTRLLLEDPAAKVRVLARGEHRLNEMRREFSDDRLSFFVGDVRDRLRLRRALEGADYVFHLAALKHVHTCEYDVLEAVRTNIDGTANVVEACIDAGVKRSVLVSTDKAVEPTTTYGATKMMAERIFIHGNSYSGGKCPEFYAVRYGNVMASQGSVLKIWKDQAEHGEPLTIVDAEMTRFWWTVGEAARFVQESMTYARPGDIYVPLLPACSLRDLAEMVAPGAKTTHVDGHPMEKMHEDLISSCELDRATYIGNGVVRLSMVLSPPVDEERFHAPRLNSGDISTPSMVAEKFAA